MNNVIFIAATNLPWELDNAILSRFGNRIFIPLPDSESRENLIYNLMLPIPNSLSEEDYNQITEKTEGFSGRDIVNLFKHLITNVRIKKLNKVEYFYQDNGKYYPCDINHPNAKKMKWKDAEDTSKIQPPLITVDDFNIALKEHKKSPSQPIGLYKNWTEKYGENGN